MHASTYLHASFESPYLHCLELDHTPKKTIPKAAKESAEFSFPDHSETIGFATHEAVPMTMFYRNASSVGENALQRPTLKELHEGFDVLDEEIVSFSGTNVTWLSDLFKTQMIYYHFLPFILQIKCYLHESYC